MTPHHVLDVPGARPHTVRYSLLTCECVLVQYMELAERKAGSHS